MTSRTNERPWYSGASALRLTLSLCAALYLSGCVMMQPAGPKQLATSLQELVPHADRDHFVYLWQRTDDNGRVRAGIQVEHVTAIGEGEFEITVSEDGVGVGHTRVRDDGHALLLISEEFGPGHRLSYDPPLPQLEMPLVTGERRATATAELTQLSSGHRIGSIDVTQVVRASDGPEVHSAVGDFKHSVRIDTVRSLYMPGGVVELSTATVLVLGIGETLTDGAVSGITPVHRELACATIGGRSLGNCQDLNARLEDLRNAGSGAVR